MNCLELQPGIYFEYYTWYYKVIKRNNDYLYCQCWTKKPVCCLNRKKLLTFALTDKKIEGPLSEIKIIPKLLAIIKLGESND